MLRLFRGDSGRRLALFLRYLMMKLPMTVALLALPTTAHLALATDAALDKASNAPYVLSTWSAGQNGGFGFQPWQFETSVNPSGSAGLFLATTTGNPDLDFVATEATPNNPVKFAWGTFANDGAPVGDVPGLRMAAAKRSFSGGSMIVGQTFEVWFENGNIRSGNLNPNNGLRDAGWVGFTLTQAENLYPFVDPFEVFGSIHGAFGFGFLGGGQNYRVYDTISPSGRDTGIPFTRDGLQLEFTLTTANTYTLEVFSASSGTPLGTMTGTISGSVSAVVLHNRNSELNDAFFNSLRLSARCVADVDDGTGSGIPDGGVGIEDLIYYLGIYDAGDIRADVDNGTATGTLDGGVGIEDLLYFLSRYEGGC